MTCAKKVVKARLLCLNGKYYFGENTCAKPQAVCPREKGEGYLKCLTVCAQPMHAEIAAMFKAIDDGSEIRGGRMSVWHSHVCEHCRDILSRYDIQVEIKQ